MTPYTDRHKTLTIAQKPVTDRKTATPRYDKSAALIRQEQSATEQSARHVTENQWR